MLEIYNISKTFEHANGRLYALKDLNLHVENGEFVCLVGPSGCGKSTLLNLIAELDEPTSGDITKTGKVGFMFQEPTLFPWLKVKDNVAVGLKMSKADKETIFKKVDYYLNMVHLYEFKDVYPHQLSGGMKQKVALARTLILDPEILLMDEPFVALDAQAREVLYGELQNIWEMTRKTILFVTHNVREAVCLGDRVAVFSARPGMIKKEFKVTLPRPRELGDLDVIKLSNEIKREIEIEIKPDISKIMYENKI